MKDWRIFEYQGKIPRCAEKLWDEVLEDYLPRLEPQQPKLLSKKTNLARRETRIYDAAQRGQARSSTQLGGLRHRIWDWRSSSAPMIALFQYHISIRSPRRSRSRTSPNSVLIHFVGRQGFGIRYLEVTHSWSSTQPAPFELHNPRSTILRRDVKLLRLALGILWVLSRAASAHAQASIRSSRPMPVPRRWPNQVSI